MNISKNEPSTTSIENWIQQNPLNPSEGIGIFEITQGHSYRLQQVNPNISNFIKGYDFNPSLENFATPIIPPYKEWIAKVQASKSNLTRPIQLQQELPSVAQKSKETREALKESYCSKCSQFFGKLFSSFVFPIFYSPKTKIPKPNYQEDSEAILDILVQPKPENKPAIPLQKLSEEQKNLKEDLEKNFQNAQIIYNKLTQQTKKFFLFRNDHQLRSDFESFRKKLNLSVLYIHEHSKTTAVKTEALLAENFLLTMQNAVSQKEYKKALQDAEKALHYIRSAQDLLYSIWSPS